MSLILQTQLARARRLAARRAPQSRARQQASHLCLTCHFTPADCICRRGPLLNEIIGAEPLASASGTTCRFCHQRNAGDPCTDCLNNQQAL